MVDERAGGSGRSRSREAPEESRIERRAMEQGFDRTVPAKEEATGEAEAEAEGGAAAAIAATGARKSFLHF